MKDDDSRWIIVIIAVMAFLFGFIIASALYDNREISEEDYYELQKSQWYE